MPIWVYRCPECHAEHEYLSGVIRATEPACPACGIYMERAPTALAIHFRGTGWTAKGPGRQT